MPWLLVARSLAQKEERQRLRPREPSKRRCGASFQGLLLYSETKESKVCGNGKSALYSLWLSRCCTLIHPTFVGVNQIVPAPTKPMSGQICSFAIAAETCVLDRPATSKMRLSVGG